jgi:hypothetical protein
MALQTETRFAQLMADKESFATTLFFICADSWGLDFTEWEPESLILEAKRQWKVDLPAINRDKIWALVTYLTTDKFYTSLDGFLAICHALNNVHSSFQMFSPARVSEMAWALAETTLFSTPEKDDKFNEEIVSYAELRLKEEGFSSPPRMLREFRIPSADESNINTTLEAEGIDYKAHWDGQQRKRLEVENDVGLRLMAMVQQLAQLPLQHAKPGALQSLLERAQSTLSAQSRSISEAGAGLPRRPSL